MVEVIKTRKGYVKAYMEYSFKNADGKRTLSGDFLHIHQLWVHPDHRRRIMLKEFIRRVYPRCSRVHTVYWRNAKNDRVVKYHISRFEKYSEVA